MTTNLVSVLRLKCWLTCDIVIHVLINNIRIIQKDITCVRVDNVFIHIWLYLLALSSYEETAWAVMFSPLTYSWLIFRPHFHKGLSLLCLLRSTMSIQLFSALGKLINSINSLPVLSILFRQAKRPIFCKSQGHIRNADCATDHSRLLYSSWIVTRLSE